MWIGYKTKPKENYKIIAYIPSASRKIKIGKIVRLRTYSNVLVFRDIGSARFNFLSDIRFWLRIF